MSNVSTPTKKWSTLPLSEAVYVNPSVPVSPLWDEDQELPHVPMATIDEVNGLVAEFEFKPWRELMSGKARFEERDILFARITPCTENGKVAFVRALPGPVGFGSSELYILRAGHLVVPEYLWFFVRSAPTRNRAAQSMTGSSGRQRVPKSFWDRLLFPLPPVTVQHRIVEILTKADDVRRKGVEAEGVVSAVFPSLFRRCFGDPSTNPHGWPVRTLAEFEIDTRYGTSVRTQLYPPGDPVLRIPNVIGGRIDTTELKYLSVSGKERTRLLLREGDLLVVRTNGNKDYVGRCAVFDMEGDWLFASYLIRIRFHGDELLPEYVAAFLMTSEGRREIDRLTRTSAGQYNLSAEGIRSIRLLIPPPEVQREFVSQVKALQDLSARFARAGDARSAVLSSIVSQAFTGELTADWEHELAEEIATHQRVHEELPRLVLVGLLSAAQREAQRRAVMITALMKYAFIFQMQNRARQRLYAFRPYKYGPFASEIYDHLGVLEADGLVIQKESDRGGERDWHRIELTQKGRAYARELLPAFDAKLVEELASVAREYAPLDHDTLLDRVYSEYPEFARKSIRGRKSSSTRRTRK